MSQAIKKVENLISRLEKDSGVQLQSRKDAIKDFTNWFLSEKPELDSSTIKLLLSGNPSYGFSIGIIQFCGKQKNAENVSFSPSNSQNGIIAGYQYKESVKLALELFVSCIHESFGMHAKSFQNELKNINLGIYIQARLDIHIQMDEMKEYAGILIDAIIAFTTFTLSDILPNQYASNEFKKWFKDKKGIDFTDNNDKNNNDIDNDDIDDIMIITKEEKDKKSKRKKPIKWEDVRDEDLIIDIDDDQNGGNDEWFDTLDFVGKIKREKEEDDDDDDNIELMIDIDDDDDNNNNNNYNDYYFDDPLGQKKRYHVKKSIEQYNKKKKIFFDLKKSQSTSSTSDIIDTYYQYSPNIIDENFNATNFLVEIHNETDFYQLQNGLDKIEKFVRDQSHKMKELVREHFDEFVFCKDTIDSIHKMLNNNNMLKNTNNIITDLDKIEQESISIYGEVLQRTKKAKILYETLQLIKQPSFKFLFTLPQQIKYHIMMRNYDQIIRIYKRVKNIQSQIDKNELLNKILFELNNTIKKLKENLLNKLSQSDIFGDEQERIIFYLIQLDCKQNPAIYFLNQRYSNIIIKLDNIYKKYGNNNNNNNDIQQQKKFIKKICQIFNHYIPSFWKLSKAILDSKFTKTDKEKEEDDDDENNDIINNQNKPKRKKTIDIQNEKIVKQRFKEITNKFVNYIEFALNLNHKNKKYSHLYYIDSAKETLRLLLSAYCDIKLIGILPNYLYNIDNLISKIIKKFLNILFEKSLKYILNTLSNEKWKPHRDIPGVTMTPLLFNDEISKNLQIVIDIGIKILYDSDDQYLNNLNDNNDNNNNNNNNNNDYDDDNDDDDDDDIDEYIPFQDDIISNPPSNVSKLSENEQKHEENDINKEEEEENYQLNALWLVPLIGSYFVESHKIFSDCLHELVYPSSFDQKNDGNDDNNNDINNNNNNNNNDINNDNDNDNKNKINILSNYSDKSSDKKLLYILGNTIYTKETILEKVWTKFIKKSGIIGHEYISILEISKNNLIDLYNSLEQMVFDKYVRCKTLLLNRVIDNSLLCDGINWETISQVKGIRNHCLQLLLHFVFIHNEVYNSSKQELDNVLISLLEKVSDHLLSTIKQIDSFSPCGALQILIEIDFIKNTLSKYLQKDGSQIVFKQIKQLLYQWIDQDLNIIKKRKQQLTQSTKQSTIIMFACFSSTSSSF